MRAAVKTPTTPDVTGGILAALARLTATGAVGDKPVDAVMIGTTHFINAVVQRRVLEPGRRDPHRPAGQRLPAAVLRLAGGPGRSGRAARSRWSRAGTSMTAAPSCRSTARRLRDAARRIGDSGHPLGRDRRDLLAPRPRPRARGGGDRRRGDPRLRRHAARTDLGRIGLLERENAALLNAALADLARRPRSRPSRRRSRDRGFAAPLYITQNDGTVTLAGHGHAAAGLQLRLRGRRTRCAAPPSSRGFADAIVVDVGGTTTDIGQLYASGFPREANAVVEDRRRAHAVPDARPALVRARRRQPCRRSIGRRRRAAQRRLPPDRGRARLRRRAAHRDATSGRRGAARPRRPGARGASRRRDLPGGARAHVEAMVEESVDRMKTDAADVPLIAVGGGAFLVPERLAGVSEVVRVPHRRLRQRGRRRDRAGLAARSTRSSSDLSREAAIAAAQRARRRRARSPPAPIRRR